MRSLVDLGWVIFKKRWISEEKMSCYRPDNPGHNNHRQLVTVALFSRQPNIEKLEAERNIPELVKALNFKKMYLNAERERHVVCVRKAAAEALGKLGDKRAVEPLITVLTDYYPDVCRAAAEALVEIGGEAVEPLIAALAAADSRYDPHRCGAAAALGKLGDKRAVEPLCAVLADTNCNLRSAAAEVLGKLGDKRAVEPLCAALANPDIDINHNSEPNRAAVAALIEIGDKRAVEPLIAALADTNFSVRRAAAEALGEIGDKRAVEPLIAALTDTDVPHDFDSWYPYRYAGAAVSAVRCAAAEILGRLGDERAVEPLIAALNAVYPDLRCVAAEALGKLGDKRAVEPLIAALNADNYIGTRHVAAKALGEIGDKRAVESLIAVLTHGDPNLELVDCVASALRQAGVESFEGTIKRARDAAEERKHASTHYGGGGCQCFADIINRNYVVCTCGWQEGRFYE